MSAQKKAYENILEGFAAAPVGALAAKGAQKLASGAAGRMGENMARAGAVGAAIRKEDSTKGGR